MHHSNPDWTQEEEMTANSMITLRLAFYCGLFVGAVITTPIIISLMLILG